MDTHVNARPHPNAAAAGPAALLVVLALAAPAAAQELATPGPRQGYYFGVATQAASSFSEDDEIGTMRGMWGGGISSRGGQMLTDWLGLGLQMSYAFVSGPRWQGMQTGLLLDVQVVPISRLVLRAGAGLGAMQLTDRKQLTDEVRGGGGAYYSAAVSYDFFPWYRRPSGGMSLAPVVQVTYVPGDSFHALTVWAGIEVLWWSGLPKAELDLPVEDAFAR